MIVYDQPVLGRRRKRHTMNVLSAIKGDWLKRLHGDLPWMFDMCLLQLLVKEKNEIKKVC